MYMYLWYSDVYGEFGEQLCRRQVGFASAGITLGRGGHVLCTPCTMWHMLIEQKREEDFLLFRENTCYCINVSKQRNLVDKCVHLRWLAWQSFEAKDKKTNRRALVRFRAGTPNYKGSSLNIATHLIHKVLFDFFYFSSQVKSTRTTVCATYTLSSVDPAHSEQDPRSFHLLDWIRSLSIPGAGQELVREAQGL